MIRIGDDITVPTLVEGYESIFVHDEFRPNMHAIWDLRTLNLTAIPLSDIRQLPRELRRFMQRRGDAYKAALVTDRAADYQLLRIYLGILNLIGSNFKLRLFRKLEDAYEWIESER